MTAPEYRGGVHLSTKGKEGFLIARPIGNAIVKGLVSHDDAQTLGAMQERVNEILSKIGLPTVEEPDFAREVALLIAAGIVRTEYRVDDGQSAVYSLTDEGKEIAEDLYAPLPPVHPSGGSK